MDPASNADTVHNQRPLDGSSGFWIWKKLMGVITSWLRVLRRPSNQTHSSALHDQGNISFRRFQESGRMDDLEDAIISYRKSLDLRGPGHPGRSDSLNNLAAAILTRMEQTGRMEDLEEAIGYCHQSLDLRPPGHSHRSLSLSNLANAILTRFKQTGSMGDLEEAIGYCHQSVNLRPLGHPHRSDSLSHLASATFTRFEKTGSMKDLEAAIASYRQSLDLRFPGHPHRSGSLNDLANVVYMRFERTRKMEDLEEAITFYRESLDLRPPGHLHRPDSLSNLANAILTRFEQTGKIEDLEEAIDYCHQSVDLCLPSHPHRSDMLSILVNAILTRFEKMGKIEDLEKAITFLRQMLHLRPPDHPHHSLSLNSLANTILTRFGQIGKMEDLEEAITLHRQSLHLRPPGHPDRSDSLMNLAAAIVIRFEQTGKITDLEEAITFNRQSLHLRPPGHPDYSTSLINLGNAIVYRFGQTGKMEDLEEAITFYHQSLHLRPSDHPDRSAPMINLANAIVTRFEQTGEMKDLNEAITFYRQSLTLCPPAHPHRSISLMNLAAAIRTRYKQTGDMEDLEEAIGYCRQSLDLRPPGHPHRSSSLSNLASAILNRFQRTGKMDDLHDATRHLSDAEASLPTNHPMHAEIWSQLAAICLEQHRLHPSDENLSKAFILYRNSANHHTASFKVRFAVARIWAFAAGRLKHKSTLPAHSTSLTLLDRYLVATPSVESQQKFLASTATIPKSLASDAASIAIEAGQLDVAVELLERGRVMILSKMRKYRPPLVELRAVDPKLADEFETLSIQLERNAMSLESERAMEGSPIPFDVQQQTHRLHSEKWEEVVERIRKVEGFVDFLQAIPFATLQTAAVEGPVVVVNVSQYRSDAIIVRSAEPPVAVPLPDASPDDLAPLSSRFNNPRVSSAPSFSKDLRPLLQKLWRIIVQPVTEQLAALGVAENTRIWWCPTSDLCALPLHAAGAYTRNQRSLPDIYISSYTSTLSALIASRSNIVPRTRVPNLLVIGDTGQPDAPIPNVEEELCRIMSFGDFVNVLFGGAANRDNVIFSLQQHSWAHFSCHGHRHPEPFHSSFQLYGGERLELLDLMKARLPYAEHAFLSACHAAAADIQGTPDEVLHLAGALQFCGFRSVVGTMWAMADIDGPDVAADFYRYMFRRPGGVADYRDSAKALNIATRAMRRREGMTLGRWVNFIHIGA